MAESLTAVLNICASVVQTLDADAAPDSTAANRKVTHNQFGLVSTTLNSTTTPDIEKVAAFEQALTDGAATIDLTALVGTNTATVNANGKKVRLILIEADSANANPITVSKGASNGYTINGQTFTITLEAGDVFAIYVKDGDAVGSGAKTIDLAGTGTQSVKVKVLAG